MSEFIHSLKNKQMHLTSSFDSFITKTDTHRITKNFKDFTELKACFSTAAALHKLISRWVSTIRDYLDCSSGRQTHQARKLGLQSRESARAESNLQHSSKRFHDPIARWSSCETLHPIEILHIKQMNTSIIIYTSLHRSGNLIIFNTTYLFKPFGEVLAMLLECGVVEFAPQRIATIGKTLWFISYL